MYVEIKNGWIFLLTSWSEKSYYTQMPKNRKIVVECSLIYSTLMVYWSKGRNYSVIVGCLVRKDSISESPTYQTVLSCTCLCKEKNGVMFFYVYKRLDLFIVCAWLKSQSLGHSVLFFFCQTNITSMPVWFLPGPSMGLAARTTDECKCLFYPHSNLLWVAKILTFFFITTVSYF